MVEYSGKKILFDTGNNPEILAANARALNIDLKSLDFVVISHRHGDHTSGLNYLLRVNPKIRIYVPAENFGAFGSILPMGFYKSVDSLPRRMRYFQGEVPRPFSSGSAWPSANFVPIDAQTEVAPGLFLIPTVSKTPGTLELRELSLAMRSPRGLVLVVGCSHSGSEEILSASSSISPHVHMVIGGLHLVKARRLKSIGLPMPCMTPGDWTASLPGIARESLHSPNSDRSSVRPMSTGVWARSWRFSGPGAYGSDAPKFLI